jgi:hypothetical protein
LRAVVSVVLYLQNAVLQAKIREYAEVSKPKHTLGEQLEEQEFYNPVSSVAQTHPRAVLATMRDKREFVQHVLNHAGQRIHRRMELVGRRTDTTTRSRCRTGRRPLSNSKAASTATTSHLLPHFIIWRCTNPGPIGNAVGDSHQAC